jgi:CTP synthase
MSKFIFVTGGVVSGLGKGITAASLGRLLKARGLKVASQKLDPYMNIDPGTMSPLQHGEVFVTDDGTETDLDLGHYERFIDEDLNKFSNLTSGKVYWNVLSKERRGEYLGKTVQIIPHVTDEIKSFIYSLSQKTGADVVITEIGGTIGDIESQPFLEAIRQIGIEVGKENRLYIHVTLVPYLASSKEHKSKPTQHSVKEMQGLGLFPDIIVTRSDEKIEQSIKDKIALFCNVRPECVIENTTLDSLYKVPLMLLDENMDQIVCDSLGLKTPKPDMTDWNDMIYKLDHPISDVYIGIVGKYTALHDAYLSVIESLNHAGIQNRRKVVIRWIESSDIRSDQDAQSLLKQCDGILVPGGFGNRGIEGMVIAARYARTHKVPYFGICLGMQVAVIEFARDVLLWSDADSGEFSETTSHPVIALMPDQMGNIPKGGTMRLGSYPCVISDGTLLRSLYKASEVGERHRHRYEFSNSLKSDFEKAGLVFSGTSPDGRLVEACELSSSVHPFFIGVQYHPEFKSRPVKAHPIFDGFVKASSEFSKSTAVSRDYN